LDVPEETRAVVDGMVDAVRAWDPLFFRDIEDPIPLEQTHEYAALQQMGRTGLNPDARRFCQNFDAELAGKRSRLLDFSSRGEQTLARAVRHVLGLDATSMDDATAVACVLSPARNPNLAGALNLSSMGKLSRAMTHVHYTFQKKLSHSADSQDQRHRAVLGTRPVLHTHYAGQEPDVVVPKLVAESPAALERFMGCMQQTWQTIDSLLDAGVAPHTAMYLLPNAFPIRFEASGDLMGWHHKWTLRLCYNAQEEIWQAAIDEAQAVRSVHPRIGAYLMPPCGVRRDAGVRPLCPEGPRYCGVPVWKKDLSDYARTI
jgi:hypothetical protein